MQCEGRRFFIGDHWRQSIASLCFAPIVGVSECTLDEQHGTHPCAGGAWGQSAGPDPNARATTHGSGSAIFNVETGGASATACCSWGGQYATQWASRQRNHET